MLFAINYINWTNFMPKINLVKTTATSFIALFSGITYADIPFQMTMPVNGLDWYLSPGSPAHTASGGIDGADDRNALDINLAKDADAGKPVYAMADGFVERNIGRGGWGSAGWGQLLLKHLNPDGSAYYCGYMHMKGITAQKATQGAYVKAGTQIGTVSNVSPGSLPNHLHFACYVWNGTRLVAQPMTIGNALNVVTSRPNVGITGNIFINSSIVNKSPWKVPRIGSFQMSVTFKNFGTERKNSYYRVIMTRDEKGSEYIGKIAESTACINLQPAASTNQWFIKPGFVFQSQPGNYWLQIYYDDCSSPNAALQRASVVPIQLY